MSSFIKYLDEIKEREELGLSPKPIDDGDLLKEIISNILDEKGKYHSQSLNFFIYNVLPGTTSASKIKSIFLKEIILGNHKIESISIDFAFELLSHMKGGPSIEVLLDLALEKDSIYSNQALDVLKTQVFLYEADMERIKKAYKKGNLVAEELLLSYSKAEFFTNLPEIPEKINCNLCCWFRRYFNRSSFSRC